MNRTKCQKDCPKRREAKGQNAKRNQNARGEKQIAGPLAEGVLDPEHEGKNVQGLKKERINPPLSPHGGPERGAICRVQTWQASTGEVKKPYKTSVILRVWLSEIGPIKPERW